ncbi:RCC1 and BTB domain-containing protein 1-like isoform X2 [Styela clava]|uniref:RCC1 and BTB domain-containing protein 1-like isoform X2 n=1 Tax=Styela clava TaxID=7725 RepID=UPI00193958D3|nr:RCC1 and BTB domain-containing protein 1-like isoform X2 [Styela clava]
MAAAKISTDSEEEEMGGDGQILLKSPQKRPSQVNSQWKTGDLTLWPVLNLVEPELRSKVKLVYIFSQAAAEVIFTTTDDKVYGMGTNTSGCLGVGDTQSSLAPRRIELLEGKKLIDIAAGAGPHVLVLTHDHDVYIWGENSLSQLGNGEGEVYSWGHNSYMQLGNGGSTPGLTPTMLARNLSRKVVGIACGSHHSMVLTDDGEVYAWGYNNCGQIGSGSTSNQTTPRKVNACIGNKRIIHIACGQTSSLAVTDNGEVYSWGYNGNGQLGVGNNVNQTNPCRIAALQNVVIVQVVCGYAHTLALSDEGIVYGWGANSYGQLGSGNKANAVTPIQVASSVGRVVLVAASHYSHSSSAQNQHGQVYMWGQLRMQSTAQPILTDFSSVDAVFAGFSSPPVSWRPMVLSKESEPSVQQSIACAFNDETTSDLRIVADGKVIYVHKALLKIRCDYFRRMFQSHWDENTQDKVEIIGYSFPVVYSFLKWLYTDTVELPPEDAIGLLDLATAYCEAGLKQQCEKLIKEGISVENSAILFAAAIKYQAKDLEEYCFQYCLNHTSQIVQTDNFQALTLDVMRYFITEAAKRGAFKR